MSLPQIGRIACANKHPHTPHTRHVLSASRGLCLNNVLRDQQFFRADGRRFETTQNEQRHLLVNCVLQLELFVFCVVQCPFAKCSLSDAGPEKEEQSQGQQGSKDPSKDQTNQ